MSQAKPSQAPLTARFPKPGRLVSSCRTWMIILCSFSSWLSISVFCRTCRRKGWGQSQQLVCHRRPPGFQRGWRLPAIGLRHPGQQRGRHRPTCAGPWHASKPPF